MNPLNLKDDLTIIHDNIKAMNNEASLPYFLDMVGFIFVKHIVYSLDRKSEFYNMFHQIEVFREGWKIKNV
jgi:hypothetical protein